MSGQNSLRTWAAVLIGMFAAGAACRALILFPQADAALPVTAFVGAERISSRWKSETEEIFAPVEMIRQLPELPNGCEVTSLAMLLACAGAPIDKIRLYEQYLPREELLTDDGVLFFGPDPEDAYAGDAKTEEGWYCFEEPVVRAANAWLKESESLLRAEKISGLDRAALDTYAQENIPLVVWVTINYEEPVRSWFGWSLPDWTAYYPYANLHCVVLAGEEKGCYCVADPLIGMTFIDKDVFWASFDAMGRRAVKLAPVTEEKPQSKN